MSLHRSSHALSALASSTRLRLLALLETEELCVCQLTTVLGIAPSTASTHLAKLHREHFIERSKDGRWVSYRLAENGRNARLARSVLEGIRDDEQIERDRSVLLRVLRIDRERLAGSPDEQRLVRLGRSSESTGEEMH